MTMFVVAVTFLIYFIAFGIIFSSAVKHLCWNHIRKRFTEDVVERIEKFIDVMTTAAAFIAAVFVTIYTIQAGQTI